MNDQAMKDTEETYIHITKWRKPIWKNAYFMIPIIRHFGKGKTIKFGGCQGLEEGMKSIVQRIFRAVILRYMPLHTYPNARNVQP